MVNPRDMPRAIARDQPHTSFRTAPKVSPAQAMKVPRQLENVAVCVIFNGNMTVEPTPSPVIIEKRRGPKIIVGRDYECMMATWTPLRV